MGTPKKKSAPKPTVSGVLRETIRERGLTAYAAAKKSGVSVDAVQRFLKDERGLTLGTVDKLAGSLGLTLCPDDKPAGGGADPEWGSLGRETAVMHPWPSDSTTRKSGSSSSTARTSSPWSNPTGGS